MFGGSDQDQGYTNGIHAMVVSPNLADYLDDPCLPKSIKTINKHLTWLQSSDPEVLNMTFGIGQAIFTPEDKNQADLVKNDRPYAGALMASVGYNAVRGRHLSSSQLRVGVVGPAALGGAVQNEWHRMTGHKRFRGWRHQLRNEPVVQLIHERRIRWEGPRRSGWGWDVIGHAGASVGNFATYANAGLEWRVGYRLPQDFGTIGLRPATESYAPAKSPPSADNGWAGHLFVAVDGRWVMHDITLDGNTFRSSHSVSKRPFVADIGYGLAVTHGKWKFAIGRYHRTREFRGQQESPVYGSFTVSRRF